MNISDIISHYPEKTIEQTFKDRSNALIELGSPKEQIESKKSEYINLFKYDKIVLDLKKEIENDKEINDFIGKKISLHFSNIRNLKNNLEQINTTDPKNVQQVFEPLNRYIQQNNFQNPINIRVNSQDVGQGGISYIEYLINDVNEIIEKINSKELNLNKETIEQAQKISKKIITDKEKYEIATKLAENRIETEGKAVSYQLQDRALIFENKSKNHESKPIFKRGRKFLDRPFLSTNRRRFVGGLVFGGLGLGIIVYFINKADNANSISVGSALLRISMVLISSFFAFFCLQQFTDDRKLGEIYTFKGLALRTMDDLLKSYTEQKDKEQILNKALDIIFSEPKLSEKSMVQQKYVDDIIEIAKKNS